MNANRLKRVTAVNQTPVSDKTFEKYDDVPSPETFKSGDVIVVVNDPVARFNGFYLAAGSPIGRPAETLIPK